MAGADAVHRVRWTERRGREQVRVWGQLEAMVVDAASLTPSSEEGMGVREGMTSGSRASVRGVSAGLGWVASGARWA